MHHCVWLYIPFQPFYPLSYQVQNGLSYWEYSFYLSFSLSPLTLMISSSLCPSLAFFFSLSSLCPSPLLSPPLFALRLSSSILWSIALYLYLSLSIHFLLSFTCCLSLSLSPCLPSLSSQIIVIVDKGSLERYSSVNTIMIHALR